MSGMTSTVIPQSVNWVIFDLGKVLIDYDWERLLGRAAGWSGLTTGEVQKRILSRDLLERFECGQVSPECFHQEVMAILGCSVGLPELRQAWNEIFTGEIGPGVGLARSCLANRELQVAVLSNTNIWHIEFLLETWPFLRELPNRFMSYDLGARKPNPAIFEHVVQALRAVPERTLFVDDLEANIRAASKLGMKTIHVRDAQRDLRSLS